MSFTLKNTTSFLNSEKKENIIFAISGFFTFNEIQKDINYWVSIFRPHR